MQNQKCLNKFNEKENEELINFDLLPKEGELAREMNVR